MKLVEKEKVEEVCDSQASDSLRKTPLHRDGPQVSVGEVNEEDALDDVTRKPASLRDAGLVVSVSKCLV